MTVGLMLLAAIRKNQSKAALHEVSEDLLNTDDERAVYNFMRNYVQEHGTFPQKMTVRRGTRVDLPLTDEPYTYYMGETRHRALYHAIRDPYADMTEALSGGVRPDMRRILAAYEAMGSSINRFIGSGTGIETSDTVLERVRAEFHLAQTDHGLRGVTSGWEQVDDITLGYQQEDLIVWVGRPGRGKSWLLIKQAYAAWQAGAKVLYISMEMSAEATMRRMVGLHSGINPYLIRSGSVQTRAVPILDRAFQELMDSETMQICTANFDRSMDQVNAFIERYLPDIIYVDAGYLLKPHQKRFGSSGRRESISDVIEEMKQAASNAHRPINTTVQFNRQAEKQRKGAHSARTGGEGAEAQAAARASFDPISHLGLDVIGESDVISQAATHVFGIDIPPSPYSQEMRVFGFLKGREGETGWWYCNYPKTRSSAIDLSIVSMNDPRIQSLMAASTATGERRRVRNSERTDLSFMVQNAA